MPRHCDYGARTRRRWCCRAALLVVALAACGPCRAAAEHIKIGMLLTAGSGPLFLAKEKGYFTAEGLDAEFVPFDAGQPVVVATVSGDIDFATAGVTSALYTVAAEGALTIIAGGTYDIPGFPGTGIVASNQAYAGGMTALKDLAGHSTALTTVGSTFHYAMAIVVAKYGIDLKAMRALPLQSLTNDAAAVIGGQADTAMLLSNQILPMLARGQARMLAWTGEEVPWQISVMWTSIKTANQRADTVMRFLAAVRRGSHDAYAAFVGPDGKRRDGPTAPEVTAIVAKYISLSVEQTKTAMGYTDPDLRLDEKDIARQIAWYEAQGFIKGDFGIDRVIDKRYVVPLP